MWLQVLWKTVKQLVGSAKWVQYLEWEAEWCVLWSRELHSENHSWEKKRHVTFEIIGFFFFSAVLNCQEKLKVFRWCGLCVTKEELFFYYLHLYTGKKQKHLHDKCNKCSYFWNIWMNMWNWGLGYTQRLQQGPLRTNICMKKEVEVLLREHFTGHLFRWLQYD